MRIYLKQFILVICAISIGMYAQHVYADAPVFTIQVEPGYPGPHESVRLSLEPSSPYVGSTIQWSKGNDVIDEGVGKTSTSITTGNIGDQTIISATIIDSNGNASTNSVLISPADVDVVWQSDGYVPPFYKGKALSPQDGRIQVIALPHVMSSDGTLYKASNLVYTWKYNGRVYADRSGYGKNEFDLYTSPRTATVSVDVSTVEGKTVASGDTTIEGHDPLVRIYADEPLKGVIDAKSLQNITQFNAQEETFIAYPYYFSTNQNLGTNVNYSWSVNGKETQQGVNLLTVRRTDNTAKATISLSVQSTLSAVQRAIETFVAQLVQQP